MYKLFYNGRIHTLDQANSVHESVLVLEDRIVFCGQSSQINLTGQQLKKTDLQGKHVYPAFTDCHTHIATYALKKERVSLDHCHTLEDSLQTIRHYSAKRTPGSWILGGGWNANIWPAGRPVKEMLDRICPKNPVALYNKDGHTLWLNSRALDICAFKNPDDEPAGGRLGRNKQGSLNGLVYEKACERVEEVAGKGTYNDLSRCIKNLAPELYALGITGAHSCESLETWQFFQEMAQQRTLPLRICMHPPAEKQEQLIQAGLRSGFGNDWLRLGGIKYFVDGSLGSQTAEMFDNFENLSHAGVEVMAEDILFRDVYRAAENGLSATIHAIGDKANFKTLNVLEKCRGISEKNRLRQRIEHAQILREDDRGRFGGLNIIASMQPMHIADDVKIANQYLGSRTGDAYPIKSLFDSACRVVFGSDMPVADPDPLKGICAAIGRRYQLDPLEPSWHPEHCISAGQALRAYTCDAAYASYEEGQKGTLTPGKLADMIVLNHALEQADEQGLQTMRIGMTVLGGDIVFQAEDV